MRIRLITPAPPNSRNGNRTTAARWSRILRQLGHHVQVSVDYAGEPADAMIALHAWRSAKAIDRFSDTYPHKPLIVALTGTDAYAFIHSHPEVTLASIESADRLIGLHDLIAETVPRAARAKLRVIYQSAEPVRKRAPVKRHFRVCVAGHLRHEKDPMRPAYAVRSLPQQSRLQVAHYGKAHDAQWQQEAERETADNPRYHWFGEVSHAELRRAYGRSHLLALPSRMEGGANVIGEAIVAGLPVVASRIDGSVGLLGADYPGFYTTENSEELKTLLLRAETDPAFYSALDSACQARAALFTVEREIEAWRQLLAEF